MFLTLFLSVAIAAEPASEAIELKTPTGVLYGTLDLPASSGPWPIVLIHPGSGPTDRDGNQAQMKNDSLKQLGQALAREGIAALRIDKRGIAASAKAMTREADIRFTHFVDDAAAWIQLLQADRRFRGVGLIGHSEGSTVGLLVAQKVTLDAFVSLCGPGRRMSELILEQLGRNAKELVEPSKLVLKSLEQGELYTDPPKSLAMLFRPSVQPYLIDALRFDPAREIRKVKCPVLVVSGSTDLQVPIRDAQLLVRNQPQAKLIELKNMSHVLKETEYTSAILQQLAVYTNQKAPLHPKLVPELVAFLQAAFPKN